MQTWKVQGYVQDSDDEADSLDFATPSILLNPIDNAQTADFRGPHQSAGRQDDDQRHEDVLTTQIDQYSKSGDVSKPSVVYRSKYEPTFMREAPLVASQSGFASQETSIQGTRFEPNHGQTPIATATPLVSSSETRHRETSMDLDEVELTSYHPLAHRSLRARKPIQLHPYGIENERYKHSLKARGIRPIHVITASQNGAEAQAQDEETQDDSWQKSSQLVPDESQGDIFAFPSSPNSLQRPDTGHSTGDELTTGTKSTQSPVDVQEEQGFLVQKLKDGKRRKIFDYSRKTARIGKINNPDHDAQDAIEDIGHRSRINIFDIPLSPPESSPPPSTKKLVSLGSLRRLQSGITPKKPLSPAASSSIRHVVDKFNNEPVAVISPTLQPTVDAIEIESDVTSTESDNSSSSNDEMQIITKRIKGVLPASWLKIDQETRLQKTGLSGRNDRRSVQQTADTRGVAQKTLRRHTSAGHAVLPLPDDDDVDTTGSGSEMPALNVLPKHTLDRANIAASPRAISQRAMLQDEDPGSDMEETHIDFMMRSATHRISGKYSSGPRQSHKALRQTKIDQSIDESRPISKTLRQQDKGRTSFSTRKRQPSRRHQSQPRSRQILLSIVDIIADNPRNSEVPPFLRLAMRAASARPDLGRHSPSRKHVRLSRKEDTAEAQATLTRWRQGEFRQSYQVRSYVAKKRQRSLAERSANPLAVVPPSDGGLQNGQSNSLSGRSMPSPRFAAFNSEATKSSPLKRLAQTDGARNTMRKVIAGNLRQFDAQLEGIGHAAEDIPHVRYAAAFPLADDHVEMGQGNDQQEPKGVVNAQHPTKSNGESVIDNNRGQTRARATIQHQKAGIRRPRKLPARRLNIENPMYRQSDLHEVILDEPPPASQFSEHPVDSALHGLGGYGHQYSIHFDVHFLPAGTYFLAETLIGSGHFDKALCMDHRDLDIARGSHVKIFGSQLATWGQWNQAMRNDLDSVFSAIIVGMNGVLEERDSSAEQTRCALKSSEGLRQVIGLNNDWLSFTDPIDRQDFVTRCSMHLAHLLTITDIDAQVLSMCVALLAQLMQIDRQQPNGPRNTHNLLQLLREAGERLIRTELLPDMSSVQNEINGLLEHDRREHGIQSGTKLEAIVILYHTLQSVNQPGLSFWDVFNSVCLLKMQESTDVRDLEICWMELISILPILRLDRTGGLEIHHTGPVACDNWQLVIVLVGRVTSKYADMARVQGSHTNDYVRILLRRCIHLIQTWGWNKSESIIGVFFDFFANRQFKNLQRETVHGSPRFLQTLSHEQSLVTGPEDAAFHLFLKLVGSGLSRMRKIYPSRKIQSIAWRCIPNHGRTFPKEQSLLETDLEALRNHHDLLCTLYWASPTGFRPPVRLIRSLVDHSNSHREACRVNVRSWTHLVSYAVNSAGVSTAELDALSEWLSDIISQNMLQYRQASSEVEASFGYEKDLQLNQSTLALRNSIITRNQTQVLATLADAAAGTKNAIDNAASTDIAVSLLRKTNFASLFTLFDPQHPRGCKLMIDALDVYQHLVNCLTNFDQSNGPSKDSEDSQDYGEWPDSQDDIPQVSARASQDTIPDISDAVFRFLSNVVGAETEPDDLLCVKVIELWVEFAARKIRFGLMDWSNVISGVAQYSWTQLRSTPQHRKFTGLFLSKVLLADASSYSSMRDSVLTAWIEGLLERESLLKYQHVLTNAVLNVNRSDPMLDNLPFVRTDTSFEVTLQHIRERRLNVLSTLLANMQRDHRSAAYEGRDVNRVRQRYASILKSLMAAMKANFLELGQQDNIRGAYVAFVQSVVGFLQQYAADITSIDKFFTDSTAFPLPVEDPTYIVGKLKGYNGKLLDPQAIKKLAVFLQNVSERAAVENQRAYLTHQLIQAMDENVKDSRPGNPSLRSILLGVILPVYMQMALQTSSGWILALPIIQASATVLSNLHRQFSILDDRSRQAAIDLVAQVLNTIQENCRCIIVGTGLLDRPSVLITLRHSLSMSISLVPCIDYLSRYTSEASPLKEAMLWIQRFCIFVVAALRDPEDALEPGDEIDLVVDDQRYEAVREFCRKELEANLSTHWVVKEDSWYIRRGNMQSQVVVDIGTMEKERALVMKTVGHLDDIMEGRIGSSDVLTDLDVLL